MHELGPPIVFLGITWGVVNIFSLYFRFKNRKLQQEERLHAIEKGHSVSELALEPVEAPEIRPYYRRGLMWSLLGVAVVIVLAGLHYTIEPNRPSLEWQVYEAKRLREDLKSNPEAPPIPEDRIQALVKDEAEQERQRSKLPLGLALLGLLPLAVGVSYLIYDREEQRVKLSMS